MDTAHPEDADDTGHEPPAPPDDTAGAPVPDDGPPEQVAPEQPQGIEVRGVAIRRRRAWLLPATSLRVDPGRVTLAVGDPDDRHALLALAVGGRLAGMEGEVRLGGAADVRLLQRAVALVDVVGVTAPEPVLPVRAVVGEDLAMAGRRAWPRDVAAWLEESGLADGGTRPGEPPLGDTLLGDLEPVVRVDLMTRLALLRDPGFLVLALPERHGALPAGWWRVATEAAGRGPGVLVTASPTAAVHLTGHADRTATIGGAAAAPPTAAPTPTDPPPAPADPDEEVPA